MAVGALGEVPRPLGVDALVVVEGAGAEIPETQGEGGGKDGDVGHQHPVQLDPMGEEALKRGSLRGAVALGRHGDLT